ncbi:MAG: anti-sigma factor [Proteobacteria bacterium]|nr:anti-sigma factor [Pseudomonadota bacterium]
MTASRPAPLHPDELHALVDGRLPAARAEALDAALDPSAHAQAEAWRRQREALRTLHHDWLDRPLPEAVLGAAGRWHDTQANQWRRMAWAGMAAGWVLAFGLGWGLHGRQAGDAAQAVAASTPPAQFARQAAVAYAVYQPEQRHPVEVAADQQEHLVQWLSKRLARPLTVPRLQAQGFELVGGRLLPGDAGARAQFMYQSATGQRITLYLGALDGTPLEAFRFDQQGPVASFYWVERGFGYALTGELPRPALQTLATAVYEQLQRGTAQPAGTRQIR